MKPLSTSDHAMIKIRHAMGTQTLAMIALLAFVSGCGSDAPPVPVDAASVVDSGATQSDAASAIDSSSAAADTSVVDSGAVAPDTTGPVEDTMTAPDVTPAGCTVGGSECGEGSYCQADSCAPSTAGSCVQKPQVCPKNIDPVCGCNDKTYNNACEAAGAGVNVKAKGTCAKPGCKVALKGSCGAGKFCESAAGVCSDIGTCKSQPSFCAEIYAPVCGCDGKTYSNDCERQVAGASQKSTGECGPVGACTVGANSCPQSEFCKVAMGTCGGQGTCTPKGQICPAIYAPVCGCDGKTYGNECAAGGAGLNVDYKGECKQAGVCNAQNPCPTGKYCEQTTCMLGASGTCMSPPKQPCPKTTPAAQVCGCDGKTYANDCLRKLAQMAKKSDGPCKP